MVGKPVDDLRQSPLKKRIFIPGGAVGFCVLKCMLSKVCVIEVFLPRFSLACRNFRCIRLVA